MEQFKYIQPLDQMARISRTELGEKLDGDYPEFCVNLQDGVK